MKTRIFVYTALFVCLLGVSLRAQGDAQTLFGEGNELYQKGEYEKAAATYDNILSQGLASSELYYNLGNAYFRMGDAARAILNYERSLKANRSNEEAQQSLSYLNTLISDKIIPTAKPLSRRVFEEVFGQAHWESLRMWSVAFAWLMAAAFAFYLFSGKRVVKKTAFFAFLGLAVLSTGSYALGTYQKGYETSGAEAIVMSDLSRAKNEPSEVSADIFVLHTGTKVTVMEMVGTWSKVRLADGKIGWLKSKDITRI